MTPPNYDNVAITLHWLTALLVVVQFALAETWDWFSQDTRETMQGTHVRSASCLRR